MPKTDKIHWLKNRGDEEAVCGAKGRDIMYTSSPTAEDATCLKCLTIFDVASEKEVKDA